MVFSLHLQSSLTSRGNMGYVTVARPTQRQNVSIECSQGGQPSSHGGRQKFLYRCRAAITRRDRVNPAALMLALPVRTQPSILQPTPEAQPSALSDSQRLGVARRVRFQQQKSATGHDQRHRAVPARIAVGVSVKIKLPRRSRKLAPVDSEPLCGRRSRKLCGFRTYVIVCFVNRRSVHHRPDSSTVR